MELLGDKATLNPGGERARRRAPQRRLPPTERRALEILDAQDTQTKAEIRQQYKALVKDLHPDMNGGRRDDEARLVGGGLGLGADQGEPQLPRLRPDRTLPDRTSAALG